MTLYLVSPTYVTTLFNPYLKLFRFLNYNGSIMKVDFWLGLGEVLFFIKVIFGGLLWCL